MTLSGKADTAGGLSETIRQTLRRGSGDSMYTRKAYATREAPRRGRSDDQLEAREGQAGHLGVAERFNVPMKPGIQRCVLFSGVDSTSWRANAFGSTR